MMEKLRENADAAEGTPAHDDSRERAQNETETEEDIKELANVFEKAMTEFMERKRTEKGKALNGVGKEVNGMGEYGLLQRTPVQSEHHMGRVAIYASDELPDDRAPENRRRCDPKGRPTIAKDMQT